MPRAVEWCRRCRLQGLDSPVQLYPMGGNEAIKMCSNVNCSDEVNGSILSEIVKIDGMSILEFEAGPISVTDNLCDSDEEFDYCCRKASSRNALVTAKPLGQPSVNIGDSKSTAAVCSDPPLFANSSEHVHRECKTSMSTCGDAGQALITPVVAPTVSMCANPDVCMDAEKPTGNVFCDSASLCVDFSFCEDDGEPWSNIFDCELPCADNMWVDAEKPTDTSDCMLPLADSTVSLDTGESTSNIRYNTPLRADSNVCVDMEEHVYMTPKNSVVTCDDANRLTAEKEKVGGDVEEHVYMRPENSVATCGNANRLTAEKEEVGGDVEEHVYTRPDNSVATCGNANRLTAEKEEVGGDVEEHVYTRPENSVATCGNANRLTAEKEEVGGDVEEHVYMRPENSVATCGNGNPLTAEKEEVGGDLEEHVYMRPENSVATCGNGNHLTAEKEEVGGDLEEHVYMRPENSVATCGNGNHLTAEKEEVGGDLEEHVYMRPENSVATCGNANRLTAEKEEVGGDVEEHVYMRPENSVVTCDDANCLTAKKEEVGGDVEEHVSMRPENCVVTCGNANRLTAEKEEVCGVPDNVQTSFSANTSRHASSHEHGSRLHDALHIPITAVKTIVTVTASPDSDLDNSPMTPSSADLSLDAKTRKRIDISDGHAFYTSLMPKAVAVKVVASSERPLCLSKAELPTVNLCLKENKKEHVEKMSLLFNLHRMKESLNLKVVASSEVEPGLCNSVSTPTLLPSNGTHSWLEELPEELEDEVNYAVHEKENVVAVSTACMTNAAFSSTAALGAVDVENAFSHDGCYKSPHGASLSTLSQEQEAIGATVCDIVDSFERCDDRSSMPSIEGLLEKDQRAGEAPKLPEPLQEIGTDAAPTTSHEPDVVEIVINSPSQLDTSEVVQECHYQEEQSCTMVAETLVEKESSARVLSQPTSEVSVVENHEIASEVEILSTESPKLLERQTCSEASSSETFEGGTASLEVPMYSKEPWKSTENVHCYHDLYASTCAPYGLPSLEGKSEGGLPHCSGATNAAPSTELARPVLNGSDIIQGSSLSKATSETISSPQALCNEQAAIEGVLIHDGSFLSRAASYCSSPPGRREVYSPESSVAASETQSVGLVEPSQTGHSDDSRTVTNHPASSAMPNVIVEPTVVSSRISAPALVEGSLEELLRDPLAPSLYIAESMSIIGPRNFVPQGLGAEDSCTNASLTEKISLQSSDLNMKYFTELKGKGGCLSPTATAPNQRPTCSLKRTRSPSPSATLSTTVRPSSHAGGDSGTLQQCMSTGLLLRSTSTLCNKPSSSDVQEGKVKRARQGCEAMKVTIGTTATGKAVILRVSGLQKSVQNVLLKLPSDAVTGGNTQTAAVQPMNKRTRARNARTKQQEQVASTVASKVRQSKTTEKQNKSPLPPKQNVTRTGFAAVDKLAAIKEALAAPMANESAPIKSNVNARAQRQSGRNCPNKKKRQPKKCPIASPKGAKRVSSVKGKGGTPNEQVVPDMGPVLSPTSSDLSSISSKPSKSSFSSTSYNAASSFSTSKTKNSRRSNTSFKSAEDYIEAIKNSRFPMKESGSGFPGYHTVLATRPPYKSDKKSTVIAPRRRRTQAETSARPTTEAASATFGAELDRYVSELSASTDVSHYDNVLSELLFSTA